jgi:hypothetical protein
MIVVFLFLCKLKILLIRDPLIGTCDWKRVERGDSRSEDHVTEDFD